METKYANRIGYSDIEPYEIIEIRSSKKLMIRRMDYKIDTTFEPEMIAGGFSAHCTNQSDQKWTYTSSNGNVFAIRLHKDGKWYDKYHSVFRLNDVPVKFYDYNF